MLKEIAKAIWSKLGENDRANAATTIAVFEADDGKLYCTSNDVSKISQEAVDEAKKKITPIGKDYISQSGAGFHAEMWGVIQAMDAYGEDVIVAEVLKEVGASRPCCGYCSAVLDILGVKMEEKSNDIYKSWVNPITVNEESKPRDGFEKKQLRKIPDFRQNSTDYWFTPGEKDKFQKQPPDSAK